MKLSKSSLTWAIKHLVLESDGDLFPQPLEIDALKYTWKSLLPDLANLDISTYQWQGGSRYVVPKDSMAFRLGTQLDPIDSLLLAALMKTVGKKLEKRRIPKDEGRVFSYRFDPTADGRFFGNDTRWHSFWSKSLERASNDRCSHVLIGDVTDFYNQIYHHVLENQLEEAGLTKSERNVLGRFCKKYSDTVSRGLPIGPHTIHLLAEISMHPTDESLFSSGHEYCRYVDDFHIFCSSKKEATEALYDLVNTLDSEQRLVLQRSKTRILEASEFREIAQTMLVDRPINDTEEEILWVVRQYTDGPYHQIPMPIMTQAEVEVMADHKLEDLVNLYLNQSPPNYSRLGWLLRRLRQVGAPGAISPLLRRTEDSAPILGDVARYIMASLQNFHGDVEALGNLILEALLTPVIEKNEYLQIVLIDLLSRLPELNHADSITARYQHVKPRLKAEILKVAGANRRGSWLRDRKNEFASFDGVSRRAYLSVVPRLPGDEGLHWVKAQKGNLSPLERIVLKYAYRNRHMKLGPTKIQ